MCMCEGVCACVSVKKGTLTGDVYGEGVRGEGGGEREGAAAGGSGPSK